MFGCSADDSPLRAGARQFGRWLFLALALLAFGISESSALGSCGDYVVIGKPAEHTSAEVAAPPRPETPPPCHGPNCHAAPRPFAAPPVAPTTAHRAPESCVIPNALADELPGASTLLRRLDVSPLPLSGCYPPQWRPPEAADSRLL